MPGGRETPGEFALHVAGVLDLVIVLAARSAVVSLQHNLFSALMNLFRLFGASLRNVWYSLRLNALLLVCRGLVPFGVHIYLAAEDTVDPVMSRYVAFR